MPTADALLQAIHDNPDDDAPRLVYADWLLDQGDPRGEFIHTQIRLARLPADDPARPALEERERQMLAAHGATWKAELPTLPGFAWGPFERGFAATMTLVDHEALQAASRGNAAADFWPRVVEFAQLHPHALRPLALALLAVERQSSTWLELALAWLPMSDWPALVSTAVATLVKDDRHHLAEAILEQGTLQCPFYLHPHLSDVFACHGFAQTYYGTWPWRGSGQRHRAFLEGIVTDDSAHPENRVHAWWAMLETRDPTMLERALALASVVHGVSGHSQPLNNWLAGYLREVGLVLEQDSFQVLHTEEPWHLYFSPDYFNEEQTPPWLRRVHPTWKRPTDALGPMKFGGSATATCASCGGSLHHLITLDPLPADLGVTGLPRLSLEVCLSCLGWEEEKLFYRHDEQGQPTSYSTGRGDVQPQFPTGPLQPGEVYLGRAGERWRWTSWSSAAGRNLHRVGGPPAWVQSADYPDCPGCKRTMPCLIQLDSNLPQMEEDQEWLWGSGGVAYGHWCDACRVSAWHWQCT